MSAATKLLQIPAILLEQAAQEEPKMENLYNEIMQPSHQNEEQAEQLSAKQFEELLVPGAVAGAVGALGIVESKLLPVVVIAGDAIASVAIEAVRNTRDQKDAAVNERKHAAIAASGIAAGAQAFAETGDQSARTQAIRSAVAGAEAALKKK